MAETAAFETSTNDSAGARRLRQCGAMMIPLEQVAASWSRIPVGRTSQRRPAVLGAQKS